MQLSGRVRTSAPPRRHPLHQLAGELLVRERRARARIRDERHPVGRRLARSRILRNLHAEHAAPVVQPPRITSSNPPIKGQLGSRDFA